MIRASIIVVAYNSQPYLAASLGSICADLGPHDELIVVDNSSTDGSAALVREYFPQAQLLVGPNGGYAGGNNRGAAHARGAFLVFLNPDTRIEPGAIDGLIKPLADPAVGLTTACLVHMSQPELVNACGNTVHISGLTYCRGAGQPRSAFALACDVDAVSGAACAIRSELFAQLGGFDQRFFMYMEDTDLSLRARLAGYSCRYTPEAVVAHDYAMNMSPRKAFYLDRNRHLLLLKNLSGPSYRRALPALLLGELLTAGFHLLKGPRYWLVKLQVYAWLLANWDHVRAARAQAKPQQPSAEEALLRGLSYRLDFGQLMSRPLARAADTIFEPLFRLARRALTGTGNGEKWTLGERLTLDTSTQGHGDMDIRDDGSRPSTVSCPPSIARPLRIAHISATFPPYHGGTGNVCAENARELARRGHAVTVFTAAAVGAPTNETRDGVVIRRLRTALRVGNAPLLPGLLNELRGFDLIHLHYPFILGAELTALSATIGRTPLVISFHNDLIGDGGRAWLFAAYQRLSAMLTVRHAARLCVVSDDHFAASRLRGQLGERCSIAELPNGVDIRHFTPGVSTARARYGIPPAARLLLFVATLDRAHHFKGLDRLLTVLADLPTDTWLLVVGDGDMRATYDRRATALGLAGRVRFAGAIGHPDLPPIYRAADLTVLPSSPPESFGLVLIESLACGVPVVASAIPGVRAVVDDRRDGLLVPLGDTRALAGAIRELLADEATCRAMGAYGRARVERRYDWRSIGDRLELIYNEVIEDRPELLAAAPARSEKI